MKKVLFILLLASCCYAQDEDVKQLQIDSVNLGGKHIKPKQITTPKINITDSLNLSTTKKLYFDGGGDTYISEYASNNLLFYVGGQASLQMSTTLGEGSMIYTNQSLVLPALKKLYLDSGIDTYFQEESANQISVFCAGTRAAFFDNNTGVGGLPMFYAYGTVSAHDFTDRTPYPKDLEEAYNAVNSMQLKSDKSGVDHDKLTPFIKVKSVKIVVKKDLEGNEIQEEAEEVSRNLSATVSAQNRVIQDLIKRIVELEKIN